MSKKILVMGGGGFIGHHLARRLKQEGNTVICVDVKSKEEASEYCDLDYCHFYFSQDLRDFSAVKRLILSELPDEIYQLAADMGGAGFVFTGEHDADIMLNSCAININLCRAVIETSQDRTYKPKIFYSSSACMYPAHNQEDPDNPLCSEASAYPANPDSEYGWEKLFSEHLYLSLSKNYGIDVRVARFHNIFGPEGTWDGGREKAPAALCRKVAQCPDGGQIEVWGDGLQTRSFLFIDDCVEATLNFMRNPDFQGPVNIGSEEMIAINDLAQLVASVSRKKINVRNIAGPVGVRGRNSCNKLYEEKIGALAYRTLREGIEKTYSWICEQATKSVK